LLQFKTRCAQTAQNLRQGSCSVVEKRVSQYVSYHPVSGNVKESRKATTDPHADSDQRQNLITFKGSPLAHAYSLPCLVDIRKNVHELSSCSQNDRQTNRTDRMHNSALSEVITTTYVRTRVLYRQANESSPIRLLLMIKFIRHNDM